MIKQGQLSNTDEEELHRRNLNDVRHNIDRILSSLVVTNDGNASLVAATINQNKRIVSEEEGGKTSTALKARNHPLFVPSTLSSFSIRSPLTNAKPTPRSASASSLSRTRDCFPELNLPDFGGEDNDDMGTGDIITTDCCSNNNNGATEIDRCHLMEPTPINESRVTVVPKLETKDAIRMALQDETIVAFADMLRTRKAEVANAQRGLSLSTPGFAPKRRRLNDGGRSFYTPPPSRLLSQKDSVVSTNDHRNSSSILWDHHEAEHLGALEDDDNSFRSTTTSTANSTAKIRCYQDQQWEQRFEELCDFQKEFDHCCVPYGYSKNRVLAQWVKRQRYQLRLRKDGKHSTMTAKRQQQLESIGFCWDSHRAQWEERFQELVWYKATNGHCSIPVRYKINSTLAIWVKCQRRQYTLLQEGNATSNMTQERINKLNGLGFAWSVRGSNQS